MGDILLCPIHATTMGRLRPQYPFIDGRLIWKRKLKTRGGHIMIELCQPHSMIELFTRPQYADRIRTVEPSKCEVCIGNILV